MYMYIYIYIYIYINSSYSLSKEQRGDLGNDLHQGFKLGSEAGKPDWTFIPPVPRSEITMVFALKMEKYMVNLR